MTKQHNKDLMELEKLEKQLVSTYPGSQWEIKFIHLYNIKGYTILDESEEIQIRSIKIRKKGPSKLLLPYASD